MSAETSKPTTNNNNSLIWIVAAFAFFIFGGFVIAELTPLLLPSQGSAESTQVDTLFKFMLVIGGAIFLLVQSALVYSVVRFRAKPGDMSDGAPIHGNATLELVWTAIPAVIVLVLAIYSYSVWVSTTEAKPNEMTVTAIGQRFAWTFNYEIPESTKPDDVALESLPQNVQDQFAEKGTFTQSSPQLHVYAGQPVKMVLETVDSQHAFWIPAMRIKQDLLPGRTTEIRFTPILPGTYPVVCAELCGDGHGAMRAEIIVHADEAEYMTWLTDQASTIYYPPDDPVERGRNVLASGAYPCAGCHVLDDLGWQGVTGPNLNGIGDRAAATRSASTGETPEEYLSHSLYFPSQYLVPGFGALMPQFQPQDPSGPNYMPVDDHVAIVAYLCSQTSTGESACDLDNLQAVADTYR